MTLLADANVLIDLGHVDGLHILTQLASVEVLDVVFDECQHPKGIQTSIVAAGMTRVVVQEAWVYAAQPYRQGKLSLQDALCFYYAKTQGRVLMTNEKPLRGLCQEEGVAHHGTLWVVQQAHAMGAIASQELCRWLDVLCDRGSRMPKTELDNLRKMLNC